MASGLVYFGPGYRYVEVDGVADPEVLMIYPGSSPEFAAPAPAFVSREQWGCTPLTCPAKDPPIFTTVTHLIVHHTDGVNDATDWPAVIRSIWVLHVQGNGWNDIGYNYLVDPNGVLYEGRAGGDGVQGAHFSGVNGGTMGVALLGTYVDIAPPSPMLETLKHMLAWQAVKWHLDPSGERLHAASGLVLNVISGHRDADLSPQATSTTECPGNAAYTFLPQIRQEVLTRTSPCVLSVGERNRCFRSEGGTLQLDAVVLSAPSCPVSVAVSPGVDWLAPLGAAIQLAPNSGNRRTAVIDLGGQRITVTQAGKEEGSLPCIALRGVVNGADFDQRPVTADSQIAIFGENIAAGSTVAINGRDVPIEYAGATQINLHLPSKVAIGTNRLTVSTNGVTGPETNFWVTESMPAIFAGIPPAKLGGVLTAYLTGIGAGQSSWSATVGGIDAGKVSLVLAPYLAGVYEATIMIPAELGAGDYPLTFTINGVASRPAVVSVID